MAHDVIMPQMGESIAEGTVTTWLKKVGDRVERDEPLFEISTDKVDAEIPAPLSGVLLEIKVQPGQTVPINTVVAVIGEAGNGASAGTANKPVAAPAAAASAPAPAAKASAPAAATGAAPAAAKPAPAPAPASAVAHESSEAMSVEDRRRTKSSPLVRKIAAEHGVDVSQLQGSGISGRVTKTDIMSYLEGGKTGGSVPEAQQAAHGARSAQAHATGPSASTQLNLLTEVPDAYRPRVYDGDRVEDMSPMRAKIAEHMVMSRRISSHVAAVFEVDFTRVDKLRNQFKKVWEERHGVKLTFTHFIIKAAVDALKAFPVMNASIDGNKVIYHRDINLGLAVALDWGLIVPVIHKADELNLLGLARRTNDLGERARTKKLKPSEVQAGTFTITNPGIFGSMFGLPVINQPQVAIMGVGKIEKRPVVIDDMIGIRTKAFMSISFDHRLVDGAVADQFMSKVKQGIEEFEESQL